MPHPHIPEPQDVAGIRNFGWVVPQLLARGEQPPLEPETFEALHDLGVRTVLSLRPDREPPTPRSAARWPEYVIEHEREIAEAAGLAFAHAPLEDFSAPSPDEIATALTVLDREVAAAPAVYVHCRAGAGRAAVVSGAWLVAHGGTGDHAAALYDSFMRHLAESRQMPPDEVRTMRLRVNQHHVWWAMREIAEALGSPIHGEYDVLAPERPPNADAWPRTYWDALQPWRDRRDQVGSCDGGAWQPRSL
jgi:protein tyrosine phosphatase (PTP) superfamily phosphohydrolase (DUF442 family)